MKIGSLCAGYGGLEEGVRAVLGGEVAWQSEIDPGACKILAHRYPGVPNIGDMTAVDWADVEPVDVLVGGTPCQDLSHAGKRAGMTEGARSNLWVAMRDAIDQLRPSLIVWENVRGAYSAPADSDLESREGRLGVRSDGPVLRALGRVLGDLSELGFDASWAGVRAADVGAPHGRFRVFVAAWDASGAARRGSQLRDLRARPVAAAEPREPVGSPTPHAANDRREWAGCAWHGRSGSPHHGDLAADAERWGCEAEDADPRRALCARSAEEGGEPEPGWPPSDACGRGPVDWGPYGDAIRRWERCLSRPAPAPTEPGSKGQPRLSPAFVEWMQGLPAGWVTDVSGLSRNEQLKALGNGVVPQQAAQALRLLLPDVLEAAA